MSDLNKDNKTQLKERLDKLVSRETAAVIMAAYGMLESHATPEQWGMFGVAVAAIFRLAKAFETWQAYKNTPAESKTNKVESVKDTQDKPTDKPEF